MFPNSRIFYRQRGVAAVLMLLLTGLALTAIIYGTMYYIRATQSATLTTHEATQSQMRAWTGVEIIRKFLQEFGETKSMNLSAGYAFTVNGISGIRAMVVAKDSDASRLTVNIYGCSSSDNTICTDGSTTNATGATTTVQVVYAVSGDSSSDSGSDTNLGSYAINIKGDLEANGGISVTGGSNVTVNVDGKFSSNSGLSGINSLFATGAVTISGGGMGSNTLLSSNSDITLSGSGDYGTLKSLTDVTMSGGTTAVLIQTNGNTYLSNTSVSTVESIGNVVVSGGGTAIGTVKSMGNVSFTGGGAYASYIWANGTVDLAYVNGTTIDAVGNVTVKQGTAKIISTNGSMTATGGMSATKISAAGAVTLSGGSGSISQVYTKSNLTQTGITTGAVMAQGNLRETAWGSVASGSVGGTITHDQQYNSNILASVVSGLTVTVTVVEPVSLTPLTSITLQQNFVDANSLKSTANYAFDVDSSGNLIVTVANVNGIDDGTYYLYEGMIGSVARNDYLCTSAAPTNVNQCIAKIGIGFSDQNNLISYDSSTKTWTVSGKTMATGVVWFKGNLVVSSGTYYNTFLATGNISTSGASVVYSVNYAGYANICTNANFAGIYPSNLCDVSTGSLITYSVANIALLAGSYDEGYTDAAHFHGGNIDLGASNKVYGDVVAGGVLTTSGSTTIYGYIVVANQSEGTTSSKLGASTTINLNNLPSTYDPTTVNTGTTTTTTSSSASVVWSRYL